MSYFNSNLYFKSWFKKLKNIIIDHHSEIRVISFVFFLSVFYILEIIFPFKSFLTFKMTRWVNNFSIFFINTILLKFIFPFLLITICIYVNEFNIGILNQFNLNIILSSILSILIFDLIIYFQHLVFHKNNFLWKIHRVHHSDIHLDITTGLRFHPLEILISLSIKTLFIILIGPPVIGYLLFEIILNSSSMFTHSNIKISRKIDKIISKVIITPNLHRIHHSIKKDDQLKNFGFNLILWDHIFKTYTNYPESNFSNLKVGVIELNKKNELWIHKLLIQPFKK